MKIKKYNNAFTLIELLVVISIMGILLSLSIFGMQSAREASRDGRRKSDLEQIRSGLEMYKSDCGSYPTGSLAAGSTLNGNNSLSSCQTSNVYISVVPSDPIPTERIYPYTSDGITYTLCAALEQTTSSVAGCGSCGATCSYKVTNP